MLTVRFLFEEIIAHCMGICQEILEYFFVKLAYFYKKEEKKPKFTRILNSAHRKYSFTQILLGTKRTKKTGGLFDLRLLHLHVFGFGFFGRLLRFFVFDFF